MASLHQMQCIAKGEFGHSGLFEALNSRSATRFMVLPIMSGAAVCHPCPQLRKEEEAGHGVYNPLLEPKKMARRREAKENTRKENDATRREKKEGNYNNGQ